MDSRGIEAYSLLFDLGGEPKGHYLLTVFANAIPSVSGTTSTPTPANITGAVSLLPLD